MAYRKIPVDFITLDKDLNPQEPPGFGAGFVGISTFGLVALWVLLVVITVSAWVYHSRSRPHHSHSTTRPGACWSSLDPGYCK